VLDPSPTPHDVWPHPPARFTLPPPQLKVRHHPHVVSPFSTPPPLRFESAEVTALPHRASCLSQSPEGPRHRQTWGNLRHNRSFLVSSPFLCEEPLIGRPPLTFTPSSILRTRRNSLPVTVSHRRRRMPPPQSSSATSLTLGHLSEVLLPSLCQVGRPLTTRSETTGVGAPSGPSRHRSPCRLTGTTGSDHGGCTRTALSSMGRVG
jgi:hypothetical protein